MDMINEKRMILIGELFPEGIPRLWCPALTHYSDDGGIDLARMSAHLKSLIPWVRGFFIPGTTGDGWELNDEDTLALTEFALQSAQKHKIKLLVGALKADVDDMKRIISGMLPLVQRHSGLQGTGVEIFKKANVSGFAVCPLRGHSRSQIEIESSLSAIMDLGLPMALYQLPFITENEVSPETFEMLVRKYPNLIFFKDSSGADRIGLSAVEKGGIFLVRGGEGDYAKWLKEGGGCYDGFLLSIANCFAPELSSIIGNLEKGDKEKAREISERLTRTLFGAFALVKTLTCGNPYTNANKAFDHFYAFGPSAKSKEGPMLKGGCRIPREIIGAIGDLLKNYQLMPEKGYLE
jgi:4-hydroxy-tetrahydrodipicolinate synthase